MGHLLLERASSCEQALHTLAARARANADAQVEVSNSDGGTQGGGIGSAILHGLVTPVDGPLRDILENIAKFGVAAGGFLDGLTQIIPAADLAKMAEGLPRYAEAFHGVAKFLGPLALGIDAKDLYDDRGDPNAVAYDQVVFGLDAFSTGILAAGMVFPLDEVVIAPIAGVIGATAGVMGMVGMNDTAKDFIGGGIRMYEKPFIDDYEDPFRNPLETVGSMVLNPSIAAPAIGAGIVHDGVKLLHKIF